MFSLTTAVRIDKIAQDDSTVKSMKMIWEKGITSNSGVKHDASPFITWDRRNLCLSARILVHVAAPSPPGKRPSSVSDGVYNGLALRSNSVRVAFSAIMEFM